MTYFGLRRIVIFPFLGCWLSAWNLASENRLFETMVGCLLKYSILSRLDWCFLGGIRQLRANETAFLTWW